jgi:rare lipoprotein A
LRRTTAAALAAVLAAVLALAGCHRAPRPAATAQPHVVLGAPYQSDGVWNYPRPQFDLDETGLAVATTRNAGLTADGEVADPSALAAAHPTLPLPALARVTNLDTGLQVLVRVNDRGPAQRGRIIALTPRAIALLGGEGRAVLPVRVQVMEAESRQMAASLTTGAEVPPPPVATAAPGEVKAETLAPPPGVRLAAARAVRTGPQARPVAASAAAGGAEVPLRLPEQVFQVPPHPGALYVQLGTFSRLSAAEVMRQRFARLGARTATSYDAPRDRAYSVRIGPLADVAAADAALTRALAAGAAEPRLLID